jgi:predicted DNA-binding transcriptional regulator AlpA
VLLSEKKILAMRTKDAAIMLGVSEKTLKRRRADGTGPQWQKMGRVVLYDYHSLQKWLQERSTNK